ncbi:hypothetical protein G6F59_016166 [Rhizopus arrhizus]|nr:hypothetical protein G6F59_016166 [Rhizopus arrhizus]
MEIVQERLEREYNLDLSSTAPTGVYEVLKTDGSIINMDNPAKLPPVNQVEEIREPIIRANPDRHQLPGQPGADQLRAADGRSGAGLLRQAEVGVARLCLDGLRVPGIPLGRRGARGPADQQRPRGRAGRDCPPQQCAPSRPRRRDPHARTDPAPDVRCGHSGCHRRGNHRA